jgi:hypothetical protein
MEPTLRYHRIVISFRMSVLNFVAPCVAPPIVEMSGSGGEIMNYRRKGWEAGEVGRVARRPRPNLAFEAARGRHRRRAKAASFQCIAGADPGHDG